MRQAEVERLTRETKIRAKVNLDMPWSPDMASGIDSGIGFFNHMLEQIGRHGNISIEISCEGDLDVDSHHTVEDCGIALGQALDKALGDKRGIRRYGTAYVPMDETLARVALDLSGRPYCYFSAVFRAERVGAFETETVEEFFRALAVGARMTWHGEILHGENTHHQIEALFKACGRALREAVSPDPGVTDIPSSKGSL